jgi:hypothetical protein
MIVILEIFFFIKYCLYLIHYFQLFLYYFKKKKTIYHIDISEKYVNINIFKKKKKNVIYKYMF